MSTKKTILIIALIVVSVFLILFGIMRFVELKKAQALNDQIKEGSYEWTPTFTQKEYETKVLDDRIYNYNPNMTNILLLGIDTEGELNETVSYWHGGQCDAIYLISLNKTTNHMSIMQIPRDTMTYIHILGATGDSLGISEKQIALAHAYGDGKSVSMENAIWAVSNLLGKIPIQYCASINISALSPLVEMLGGVEVTLKTDLTELDPELKEGATVNLTGEQAEIYVRSRMNVDDGSNKARMERQEIFINSLMNKIFDEVKKDVNKIDEWYDAIKNFTYSKTSLADLTTILVEASSYTRDEMIKIEGEYDIDAQTEYVRFWPDKEKLFKKVLDIWYL